MMRAFCKTPSRALSKYTRFNTTTATRYPAASAASIARLNFNLSPIFEKLPRRAPWPAARRAPSRRSMIASAALSPAERARLKRGSRLHPCQPPRNADTIDARLPATWRLVDCEPIFGQTRISPACAFAARKTPCQMPSHDIFICFSSKDEATAHAVVRFLEGRGRKCWISSRDVRPGRNYQESIVQAIQTAKLIVFLFSEYSNKTTEVK